ncbi:MAG: amino acid permease [Pyrinomonadaceae bacterium]|nr:amino acid permease [Pyrinomonadaceae bacterium]
MASNSIDKGGLIRGLGLIAAISLILGNVIGTGVFFKARVMTCNLGSPTWVVIAWIAAGLLTLAGALTYAELAAMKPKAGGEYVFLKDSYGKIPSFLYGWMQIFISKTGSQAAVAVAFAIAVNDFTGGGLRRVFFETSILGYEFEFTTLQLVAVGMIILFTVVNCASVKTGGYIATFLTFVKIGLIAFVGLGAFMWATGGDFGNFQMTNSGGTCEGVAANATYGSFEYSFAAGFAAAMLGALWGYDGWNNLTLVAGEVKRPKKNLPLALIGGTILIMILYVFVHIAYFYVLSPTEIASVSKDSAVAKIVAERFVSFGVGAAVSIFTIGLMLSSIGTLHTSILSGARVPYAMAKDGMMFKSFGNLSKSRVPIRALIFQGVWACLLAMSGSFDTLTDYVIFGSWIFYALVTSSVFYFRIKHPDLERPYKAFGYPLVPILFVLVSSWLLINTVMSNPKNSLIGLGLIFLGLPVYFILNSRNNSDDKEENGN